jgi:hypothetical protein
VTMTAYYRVVVMPCETQPRTLCTDPIASVDLARQWVGRGKTWLIRDCPPHRWFGLPRNLNRVWKTADTELATPVANQFAGPVPVGAGLLFPRPRSRYPHGLGLA